MRTCPLWMRTVALAWMLSVGGWIHAQPTKPGDGPALRFVQANGIKMRIAEQGSGPLVVLLHGWPESWYSWRHQFAPLVAAGYRVVALDQRGYGRSDQP